jgi:uncharacterized protein YyaL (SSP411 family)
MTNRLQQQTSPYLLQHAGNPVDWQPWDDQALNQAINEDKPILLSIGYSACHWCHVMEAESFENPQIAEVMNDNFICIKVDREERPDLDKIYQLAHQMLTQRPGGWPLTVALTPNGHAPFFAGTYFPPESRHNMPGFGDLLKKIALHYTDNQSQLSDYHVSFEKALNKLNPVPDETPVPNPEIALESALSTLQQQYDSTFGGFGDAPKFPHPSQLELLLLGATSKDPKHSEVCSEMAVTTLSNMVNGGLYDQIGGGFFRYSVDRKWQIPHFEKMGYDNAQLLSWMLTPGERKEVTMKAATKKANITYGTKLICGQFCLKINTWSWKIILDCMAKKILKAAGISMLTRKLIMNFWPIARN